MKNILSGIYPALKDVLFPATCLLCHQHLGRAGDLLLCPACAAQMPLIQPPLCTCCGKEFPDSAPGSHLCGNCLQNPPTFSRARAVFRYNKFTAPLIYSFKYQGRTTARDTFAALHKLVPSIGDLTVPDLIIPVPLHKKRLRERGFNQSLELARLFFPKEKDKIQPAILIRCRWTTPQAGLDGHSRRQNLAGAFLVKEPQAINAKKILLIDDVLTTGTTVNECAKVLKQNGAAGIEVLTLARVLD
jgi:ComF family protein